MHTITMALPVRTTPSRTRATGTPARPSEHKQVALQSALQILDSGLPAVGLPGAGSGLDRPDTPDEVVTAVRRLPAVEAAYAPFPEGIDARLKAAFEARGVHQLYTHQAEAFAHVAAGRQVVVTTPTASGKTLCYNLPVIDRILKNPSARALYLFPTKALAQDQMAELHELTKAIGDIGGDPIGVHTYDGDTPQDARRTIRTRAHVVLSNPDMVHSGILPHHPRWAKLFENLAFVVIDELHAYRGVFGSHLTNVLRRLQRICRHYGSNPQFICSSATIANPAELAERLAEKPFSLVERSGAPRGEKFFVFVNPPVVNRELGIRRSYIAESRRVAGEFLRRNLQVIVFAQSRLSTEILTTYLKEDFEDVPGMPERIRGYRGGYLPLRRREIERGLRAGQVRGVVSTNALELGIDIGALDVCVMAGYPGTIASTWQRAGRAGRRSGQSAAVMVASSAPIDQFVARHPSFFFDASPEHALVNPDNLHILVDHVKCAAFELPFSTEETYGQVNVQEVLGILQESGLVHRSGSEDAEGQWHWTSESYPANAVSLRSVSSDNFVITDHTNGSKVIGETDFTSALSTLHPKAIYLVEGKIFQVEELDFVGRKAHVKEVDCDYYTTAITYTKVTILDRFAEDAPKVALHGEVHVVSRVVGFKKIRFQTNENVGSGELDLPEQQMHTTAYWLELPLSLVNALPYASDDRRDGVIGLAFAMKQVAQLLLMCDARDIGLSVNAGETDGDDTPRIFLYDAYPGGIGFSAPLWGMQQELLSKTSALIAGCPCDNGCPMCVGPVGETGPLAKTVALRILQHLLSAFDDAAARAVAAQTAEEVPF
ncbi:MAG TPA: DEAD/DEAH box helicase [Vicinamibacterales bacterium]|nr:DEAD/DEAH box helicase [Vicinamibacterales bacterium]